MFRPILFRLLLVLVDVVDDVVVEDVVETLELELDTLLRNHGSDGSDSEHCGGERLVVHDEQERSGEEVIFLHEDDDNNNNHVDLEGLSRRRQLGGATTMLIYDGTGNKQRTTVCPRIHFLEASSSRKSLLVPPTSCVRVARGTVSNLKIRL